MDWLGGGGYNFWALWIHGVQYTRKDGSSISGSFLPIMFENLMDPIISGREELGMPKLFSDIDVQKTDPDYSIRTSWRDATWGTFDLSNLKEIDPSTSSGGSVTGESGEEAQITSRYMPTVGRQQKGRAAEEYFAAVHLAEEQPPKVLRSLETSQSIINIDDSLGWKKLPTLSHIIERLAEVRRYRYTRLWERRLWSERSCFLSED